MQLRGSKKWLYYDYSAQIRNVFTIEALREQVNLSETGYMAYYNPSHPVLYTILQTKEEKKVTVIRFYWTYRYSLISLDKPAFPVYIEQGVTRFDGQGLTAFTGRDLIPQVPLVLELAFPLYGALPKSRAWEGINPGR